MGGGGRTEGPSALQQKHLGLILQPGLAFEKHLNEKIIKAKKNIGLLKQLSKFLPLKTLDQMYKTLVRSHLDYCDVIYHIPSIIHQPPLGMTLNSLMEKVEKIQYQAALAIIGAWQGSSRSKIYDELGWETLSDRRNCRRVLQIHKIINNNTISYLKDKLPANCKEMFSGIIRATFHAIICKSNRYKSPEEKSVFKIHDPAGLRYLFQLRVGLNPLKGHK